jgi:hypothetical protein
VGKAQAKREVRILCTSDWHCGSRQGITHPDFIPKAMTPALLPFWHWFEGVAGATKWDAHLHLGDTVDGQAFKDAAVGQITTDTDEQAEMASAVFSVIQAGSHHMVYGTPYHTAGSHSFEDTVARLVHADIRDSQYLKAGGLRISARHVVGRSDTPYSQETLAHKEAVRDLYQALQDKTEPADIVLRGHIHTYAWMDDGDGYSGVVPCLQLPGSVFGRTQRAWRYRVGVLELVIADGYCQARPHLMSLKDVRKRVYAAID